MAFFFSTSHGKGVVDGIGGSVKGSVHCKILSGRVVHTEKQVAEVAQACHTIVVIKYVSASDITHDKAMLEEWWKNIKTLPRTHKMHSIISTKDGKVKAAEVSTGTLKSKLFLQMLKLHSHPKMLTSAPVCKVTKPNCLLLCLFNTKLVSGSLLGMRANCFLVK